ncbi:MAG TPA: GDSL-type esterase/lipase family protein [Flavisolibacter sp.]|jgi:lysophospholipase L1-like esterase|nr:GDSL-type esterase/lipase family protein [Flavisolibacter sp.]
MMMKILTAKKQIIVALALIFATAAQAQKKIDSSYNNSYYQGRMELFNSLGGLKKATVFLGNSITERGQWGELLPGEIIMNRGIGGDNTFGVLARLGDVTKYKPKRIFLLIGINDLGRGLPIEVISNNYKRIIQQIKTESPKTKLYVQSVLPMNESLLKAVYLKNKKDSVTKLNESIRAIAKAEGVPYINLHPVFADIKGELKEAFTQDGIHLRPSAYVEWVTFLKKAKYL